MGEVFSEELTLQVCLIWMQSTVWYFKWWFKSRLKHTTEFTHSEKSLKYTHSNVCYICRLLSCDSNAHALRCVTPYAPIMWSHTLRSPILRKFQSAQEERWRCVYMAVSVWVCVCVCVYNCIRVGVCLCVYGFISVGRFMHACVAVPAI